MRLLTERPTIRHATLADIPACARAIATLKDRLAWRVMPQPFTAEALADWLYLHLEDRHRCLFLVEQQGAILAGCGGVLGKQELPPHLVFVWEWAWWGRPRQAVKAWHQVKAWGRDHGAVLSRASRYSTHPPIRETVHWREL
jgi:hypothetical protein